MEWLDGRSIVVVLCSAVLSACAAPSLTPTPEAAIEWTPQVGDSESAGALVQAAAAERWPNEFAGAWLKGDRIVVAFTANAEEKAAVLEQEVLRGTSPLEARTVKHSLEELVDLQERMGKDRGRAQGGQRDLPRPIADLGGQFDLDIDIEANVVVVGAERVTPELREAFRTYYDTTAISFEEGLSTPN